MDEERLLASNPDEEEAGGSTDGDASDLFPEWRERVQSTVWYYASPFAYCVAGGLLVVRPEPLERGLPLFPWRCTGFAVVCNGFMSFMADVETWGRESHWQTADRVLAIVNTLLQAGVVVMSCLGYSNFPIESPVCLGSGVVLALVCKQRSAAAFRRGDCDAFVRWHSAWHLLLPLGAVAGQLVLHRRCAHHGLHILLHRVIFRDLLHVGVHKQAPLADGKLVRLDLENECLMHGFALLHGALLDGI